MSFGLVLSPFEEHNLCIFISMEHTILFFLELGVRELAMILSISLMLEKVLRLQLGLECLVGSVLVEIYLFEL